jgi:hypothetical protein
MRISVGIGLLLFVSVVWTISAAPGPQSANSPSTYSAYSGTDPKPLPPPPALGPANTAIADPTFGTQILRVTDENTQSGQSFISIDAGFFRAWNADSTAIKLTGPHGDGYWLEFDPTRFKVGDGSSRPAVHSLPFGARWEWSTIDPHIIYYLNGSQIARYNTVTGVTTNLAGPSTGDPVGYLAVVVGRDYWVCAAAGPGIQDTWTKIFCVNPTSPSITKLIDTVNKTIDGIPQVDPNWPTSAPNQVLGIHNISGGTGASWLEVTFHQQSWGANGGAVFNLSTNTWTRITNADVYWSGHVSMGNGKYANSSGSINGLDSRGMVLRNPDDAMNSGEYRFIAQPSSPWNAWCDADHSSWLNSVTNPNAPILISRYGGSSCYQYAWAGEIDAAAVDGSNTVWRFAHTHNSGNSCYYGQAFAQISNDGRWALFSSPWDGTLGSDTAFGCSNRIDTFIVDLTGSSALPTTLNASPISASVGQTVTATWEGIASPSGSDWIGLYRAGSADTGYLDWQYVSCSKAQGNPAASGSCGFVLSNDLSSGTYQFRLFANGGSARIATSNDFSVTSSVGSSAAFLGSDTTTQGSWRGTYGAEGYVIVNDATSPPAYAAVAVTGANTWPWAEVTTDVRGLQRAVGANRFAATWYGSTFTVDVNITDSAAHQLSLYVVDWDSGGRGQTFEVRDAVTNALLETRTVTGFSGGQYWRWTVRGHVVVRAQVTAGYNAVVSGVFFDGDGAVNAPPTVTLTAPASGAQYTAPATVAVSATASDSDGIAKVEFYQALGQGTPSLIAPAVTTPPYAVTWNNVAAGTYTVTAKAYDTQNASSTTSVQMTVVPVGGGTAATFIGTDTTTKGTWRGVYGAEGYVIVNDATSPPAYASVAVTGANTWPWTEVTTDVRGLQRAVGANRFAATWYGSTFTVDVNISDGAAHQLSLYVVDWDSNGRVETVEVRDAVTNGLLDTRSISSFVGGQYWRWTVSGHVTMRVTNTATPNAVVSGLFFDTSASNLALAVALTSPPTARRFPLPRR